jgi:hypothetical protein
MVPSVPAEKQEKLADECQHIWCVCLLRSDVTTACISRHRNVVLQVHLLNAEHNPDVMLLAARAITFLADVLPSSCSSIVRHGAVPAFCARLLTSEYIDLAEQSLQVKTYMSDFGMP